MSEGSTDPVALAYAAGFFDGEGCIHISRNVRVILAGCFRPGVLDAFRSRWGGSMSRKSNSRPNQREGIRWEATGRNALKFLVEVQPYLVEKRLQADLAIQYQHRIIEMNCRGGKGHSPEDRRWFEDVRDRVRALKHEVHTYSVTRPLTERAGR